MFFRNPQDQTRLLGVFTGVLTNDHIAPIKFINQSFVGDTFDGGASVWLRHPNPDGSEMKRFKLDSEAEPPEELPQLWPSPSELTGFEARKQDAIPIRCKCKGVDFVLHKGDYSSMKKEDLPFSVDPTTHKLLAGFCGCDSCRLQSGIDVFNWTFAEIKLLSFRKADKPFPKSSVELKALVDAKDPAVGTLTYYKSSPDVERYFCSNCSACIFYAAADRPHMLDIAVGVLEASDGARAEGFLSWPYGGSISFREDGDGGWRQQLFDRVEKDAEEYRIARGYPKNWARVKNEQADKKDLS
jgi:hypothetical protein